MAADAFDYVIVGAGSAGCVLANRLSEDGKSTVCLIEAGGSDASVFVAMPSALSIPMNMPRFNWGYTSEPEPHLGGRRMNAPRGKGLGGSSSINGMVYVRGNPHDFDRWEAEGAQGWAYADVLPYFKRAETREEGGDAWRGDDGPLHTSYGPLDNSLSKAFIAAGVEAGYPRTDDINGAQQEGFGRMDRTIRAGRRWSAASAYLKPALGRPNLHVMRNAQAARINVEHKRASGVALLSGGTVQARREVIVSAGAFGSPQLLKLSGIGAASELAAQGITPVHHLPGVGENLQDHLEFYFQIAAANPLMTLHGAMGLLAKGLIGARWLLTRGGLGATNHFEACGFIRSRAGIEYPDIQYHFLPAAVRYDGHGLATRPGFQAHVGTMRSRSKGWVRLASSEPRAHPRILFNYMSDPDDWTDFRAALRLTREIFAQPAFAPLRGEELQPGAQVQIDGEIDAFLREHLESAYHPCGTCRMGRADDPLAVTDAQARVRGLESLRVVDASIMPSVTSGNLNAPTIMLGEKAADMIRGRDPLPRSNAAVYEAPDWRHRQR